MNYFYFGLDLGQTHDYSALAVVEFAEPVVDRFDYISYLRTQRKLDPTFSVRHLQRFPLGTSYPDVVRATRELTRRPEVRKKCTLVVDGTGVGKPVVDLVHEADFECDVVPVSITPGLAARRDKGWWYVPKRDLIGVMQVLLEQRRVRIANDLREVQRVIEEFMAIESKAGESGVQFGAWRNGAHDDLALAVALACWRAKGCERKIGEQNRRLL